MNVRMSWTLLMKILNTSVELLQKSRTLNSEGHRLIVLEVSKIKQKEILLYHSLQNRNNVKWFHLFTGHLFVLLFEGLFDDKIGSLKVHKSVKRSGPHTYPKAVQNPSITTFLMHLFHFQEYSMVLTRFSLQWAKSSLFQQSFAWVVIKCSNDLCEHALSLLADRRLNFA